MNKNIFILPRASFTYNIETPPNFPTNDNLEIVYSKENIHLHVRTTPKMSPVTCAHKMEARLPYGNTVDLTDYATLPLPGLSKEASKIRITPQL